MSLAPLRRVSTLLAAPRPSALAAYPVRALHAHTPAKASVSNARLSDVVEVTASGTSPAQRARSSSLSPEERKKEVQRRAEEKHRRYEARMKAKAKE